MEYSIFKDTMAKMTWIEVEKAIKEGAIAILPTGAITENGPHMTLGVSAYISHLISKLAKSILESKCVKTLLAPPDYWGINNVEGAFPGAFTLRNETMKALVYDILASFKRWGVNYVFIFNWHNDIQHWIMLIEGVKQARIETGVRAYALISDDVVTRLGLTGREEYLLVYKGPQPTQCPEIHAGAPETSIMAAYVPEDVNEELARKLEPVCLTPEELAIWRQGWSDARKITPLGYAGQPARFDVKLGKQIVNGLSQTVAGLIYSFLQGTYEPPDIGNGT